MMSLFKQLSSGIDITYEHCKFCGQKVTKVAGLKVVVYDYLSHVRHMCIVGGSLVKVDCYE